MATELTPGLFGFPAGNGCRDTVLRSVANGHDSSPEPSNRFESPQIPQLANDDLQLTS